MPLVIVTGLPSSGKSTAAKEIADGLSKLVLDQHSDRQVVIVSDSDQLDWEGRNDVYMSIAKEKQLRGWIRSEAQRQVNLNKQIVILDAACYIKGFRYELHCMTKEARTQYCIVEKLLDPEICWKWNQQMIAPFATKPQDPDEPEPGYNRETFDALVMRYEPCDDNNRWDSPLFRLSSPDDKVDLAELYNKIVNSDPLAPNKCTLVNTTSTTIYKQQDK